ncbi:hypothetical protein [Paenibacillus woosongensis]|uniref:Glycosyltransferase subfamily 4-like N-terminal domain-containing protein n=1 Tax=Paenibacillus woosongensis TaxID=307580 RepID=A0A7X3CM77_9BACL|nr:hypothetical protein [Paenibacillus woosongensis]MUG45358.1 hypothetical protein [Paenibacillus woosongensis]
MTKIAFIGTYIPQRCGIATYTHHLRQSIRGARGWRGIDPVIALRTSEASGLETAPGIWELDKHDRAAYIRAADRLNRIGVAVVSLQHEFGIFGGEAGGYVLDLAERVEKPLAVTFHTSPRKITSQLMKILVEAAWTARHRPSLSLLLFY